MAEEIQIEKREKPPSGYFHSLMNHIKCTLGSGIFALGFAFKKAGLALGPPLLIFTAIMMLYCQHLLVRVAHTVTDKTGGQLVPDYGETAAAACLIGAEKRKKFAPIMKKICNTMLITNQFGALTIYTLFFAQSVQYVVDQYICWTIYVFISMAFVPIWIASSLLLNLKMLGIFSAVANLITLIGIITTIYMTTTGPKEDIIWIGNLIELPTFIATGIFAFFSIIVVLPIYIEMKTKELLWAPWGVLNVATAIECLLSVFVGTTSFIKYGNESKGSVTLNFDIKDKLAQTVIIMVGICMVSTYALNLYVLIETLVPLISHKWGPFKKPAIITYSLRLVIIVFTCILAACVPYLGTIIGLIGAVCSTSLGIILPATIYMMAFFHESSKLQKSKEISILAFGFFVLISGVTSAIREIYYEFTHHQSIGQLGACALEVETTTAVTKAALTTMFSNISSIKPDVTTVP